ncbi:MAG: hypothetical protein ACPIOQ_73505 [Promethearchaeia archaeon]
MENQPEMVRGSKPTSPDQVPAALHQSQHGSAGLAVVERVQTNRRTSACQGGRGAG